MELFKNPNDALLFAYRYSSQQYAQSELARLQKKRLASSDKGLIALDGAAQSGFIRARVARLDPMLHACVVARYSARHEDCPCCGNLKPLDEYKEAIAALSDWAMQFVSGALSVRKIRSAIVQEFFERRRSIGKVADEVKVPRRTAYDQKAKIWPQLTELDQRAQQLIGDLLADMCGELVE